MKRAAFLLFLAPMLDLQAADYSSIAPTGVFCDHTPFVLSFAKLITATRAVSPPEDDALYTSGFAPRLTIAKNIMAIEQQAWKREAEALKSSTDERVVVSRVDPATPLEMAAQLPYALLLLSEVGTYLTLKHSDPKADDLMAAAEETSRQLSRYVSCEAEVKRQEARAAVAHSKAP